MGILQEIAKRRRLDKLRGKSTKSSAGGRLRPVDEAVRRDVLALLDEPPALSARMGIEKLGDEVHEGIRRAYEAAGRIVNELEGLPSVPKERRGLYQQAKAIRRDLKGMPITAANVKVLAELP